MKLPDLNLVMHFDALMSTLSVSGAAGKLGVTQPAVSAALGRLRKLFNDPLLVRENGVWQATARAQALHRELHPLLEFWTRTVTPADDFDPRYSARVLTLHAIDYIQYMLLPRILPSLARDAPHFLLKVVPARPDHGMGMLETNHVDLIAGYYPMPLPELRARFLCDEPVVCIMSAAHKCLAGRWNLKAFLACRHVDLAGHTRHFGKVIDEALGRLGCRRDIVATISSYMAAPYIVAESDLLAVVPARLAEMAAKSLDLAIREIPLELPTPSVSLYWHERYQSDPGHAWFRQYVAQHLGRAGAG